MIEKIAAIKLDEVLGENLSLISTNWFDSPARFYERIPVEIHYIVVQMAQSGISGRAIARDLGYHKNQVRRVLKKYPEADNANCKCGKSRKHQGWCHIRFQSSPRRQEYMELWHKIQTFRHKYND